MLMCVLFLVFSMGVVNGGTGESLDPEWVQIFFGKSNDSVAGYSVQQTTDGGYVLTGYYSSYPENLIVDEFDDTNWVTEGVCLIKTDASGTLQWFRLFDSQYGNEGQSVQQTSDGGYIIAGEYGGNNRDVWLIKTDTEGRKEWDKTFGGPEDEMGFAVVQTSDGGYIVTGSTYSYGPYGENIWLIKTDSNGTKEWDKVFGGSEHEGGRDVIQISDGGYIVTGGSWLIKTDSDGNEEWNKTGVDGRSVWQTADGGYVIAGEIGYDLQLTKTDHFGNTEWSKTFEEFGTGTAYAVQQTLEGGYILTGSYYAG
ncbi:hypothetical protein J7W08_11810 [Methanococcoides orientis]|uniref:hypothetical protein n=1 Tax=Methanococcoides orientis TaxID=2822137 RepID=UPI001E50C0CB|nr:hypothetical protein [Methanococcoides orientis]UGV40712.1 hypothetical protein J7W08_11810 [Methanococcoides orientis]